MNRCQTVRLPMVVVGLLCALGAVSACAGTSQAACNAPSYVFPGASNSVGSTVFVIESKAGEMGATASGNLVFSLTENARLRAAKIGGTNAANASAIGANGARVLATAGNGNATLPSAAVGSGKVVLGGVTFTATYLIDEGADTLVVSNDAEVAPTAIDSAVATGGSDLTYGEYLVGLAKAFNSVFSPAYVSATVDGSGVGNKGIFTYANLTSSVPATLTVDPDAALSGGTSPITVGGGLAAVMVTANAAPSKYIDSDSKLVAPFTYAPGSRVSLLILDNIALDTRNTKAGNTIGLRLDAATSVSGVTTGVATNFAVIYPNSPVATVPAIMSSNCGAYGPLTNRTQFAWLPASSLDVGKTVNYYVAAQLPNGQVYFMNGMGAYELYTGGDASAWSTGALYGRYIPLLNNADVSSVVGSWIYVGYGASLEDMLLKGTYTLGASVR